MKIILVDNFNRERPGLSDDLLIADNVSEHYAAVIATMLNDKFAAGTGTADDYVFTTVTDDYRLRKYKA